MNLIFPSDQILIVDNCPEDIAPLGAILEIYGYEVRVLSDGVSALHQALKDPPDIILLDISMPDFDGYEVCKFIKNYEDTEDIPIIFISGRDQPEDKLQAFAFGGNDYITKPFQVDEAIARINFHLQKRKNQQDMQSKIQELKAYSSAVAHDIKSPLGVMGGFADQLHDYWDEYDDESKKAYLEAIRRNSNKVANIVDELLSLSSLSQAEIDRQPLDMEAIFENATKRVAPWLGDFKGQLLLPAEWPTVLGHAPWIEEVWVNYISNAVKYGGSETDIEIGYTVLHNGSVQFWVQDFGPGLTNDEQAIVFHKHTRLKQNEQEGHGLGLTIVKRIIEKLQGEVGVASKLGKGSKFFFTLAIAQPEPI